VTSTWMDSRNRAMAAMLILLMLWCSVCVFQNENQISRSAVFDTDFVIDLNYASHAELNLLPGIGSKMADQILDLRVRQGGFESVEDLKKIRGVKETRMAALRKHVVISPLESRRR
jgi:competence ComEA-like helix-hairpin-helix protein